jgi:protein-tyrosine phosphatase
MLEAAARRGITLTGRARQVKPGDFERFDWIFAMDEDNYRDLLDVRSKCRNPSAKLVKFCDNSENYDVDDVPDPYYGGSEGFEFVLDILEDGCASLLKKLR